MISVIRARIKERLEQVAPQPVSIEELLELSWQSADESQRNILIRRLRVHMCELRLAYAKQNIELRSIRAAGYQLVPIAGG